MGVTVEVGRGTARTAIARPPAPTGGLAAALSDPARGLRAAQLGAALASGLDIGWPGAVPDHFDRRFGR